MDFSFVEDAPAGRASGQQPSGQGPPPARPLIQLPTWQEVQAAKQPSAPTILFRPTGLLSAARQQQQPQQGPGAISPPAAAAAPPSSSGPPWPHQGPPGAVNPAWQAAGPGGPGGPGTAPSFSAGGTYGSGPGPSNGGSGSGFGGAGGPAAPGAYGPPRPVGGCSVVPRQPSAPTALGGGGGGGGAAPPPNVVLVNRRQQGNPVLKHIRNVRWQFGDIVPDYQLGQNTAALFLSLRYHLLHPDYILHRIREQQRLFRLTVLLVHVDVDDVVKPLGEVSRAAVVGDCTLVCAWSPEECARWLETFKSYESKPASSIQERVDPDYVSRLAAVLAGSVRGINRTDAHTLGTTFGSLGAMMRATDPDQFSACPGIGPTKVRRLMEAFHEPFRKQLKMNTGAAAAAGPAAAAVATGGPAPAAAAGGPAVAAPSTTPAASAPAAAAGPAGGGTLLANGAAATTRAASGPRAPLGAACAVTGARGGNGGVGAGEQAVAGPSGEVVGGSLIGGAGLRGRVDESDPGQGRGAGVATAAGEVDVDGGGGEGGADGGAGTERPQSQPQPQYAAGGGGPAGAGGGDGAGEARRQQLLELFMSQMPAGDDDVSDGDEDYRL